MSKIIKSAFESESFESDGIIQVSGLLGAATISPCGRDVALASPDGLAIIDLDSPYNPPRRLRSHGLPWLVVDVQWSPFAARDYWVVSTANHRALVWNLNMRDDGGPGGAVEHSLQGHSRAITDVNFSAHHPDMLATCAVDGYVHSWDLRRPRQPAFTFCDWFAGATQVKYNRQDPHLLASCHDRLLHIWDERRACEPLRSISAHASKIYGLDWSRTSATDLVTCSLDRTIKFWDYTADVGAETPAPARVIRTEFPVWRARHTPFGTGLLAMPQNEPGDLYLYDYSKAPGPADANGAVDPVAVFQGHGSHKAREFLWRSRGGVDDDGRDSRDFQLVSWGEDKYLRLQCLDQSTLGAVGYRKGGPAAKNLVLTRKGAAYKTFRAVDDNTLRDRRAATMSDPRTTPGAGPVSLQQHQQHPHHHHHQHQHQHPPHLFHHYQPRQSALSMGMRSMLPHYPAAGTNTISWRGPSMKAKTPMRREPDRSQLQIGWMKGISLVKRNNGRNNNNNTAKGRSGDNDDADIFSPVYPDDHWGAPDTIQEELLRISHRLPKVKWENIDMDSLSLTASLNGPWGRDDESIYVKVHIEVPATYPKHRAPRFVVEKTSFMADETHERIGRELRELADQFLERKQNCLEMAFKYLLGEVDLEASTTSFFKSVGDLDLDGDGDGGRGSADESSSDESDSEMAPTGSAAMSQELPPAVDAPDPALVAVHPRPPPGLCGARFAPNGVLVCWFPTKDEKARLQQLRLRARPSGAQLGDRGRDEPVFAGFGRLTQDGGGYRHRRYDRYDDDDGDDSSDTASSGSDDDEEGDDDDDAASSSSLSPSSSSSSSSSSGSESGSMQGVSLWYQPNRKMRKAWSENRSMRSSDAGTGAGTGTVTGTGVSKKKSDRFRNVIALHDLCGQLPSRRELGREYAIFGDGAEVCDHNAGVAQRHGTHELADVWAYLALLLRQGIPLELIDRSVAGRNESVLVVARDTVARMRARSRPQSRHQQQPGSAGGHFYGRVKWGTHPLAKTFVDDLFAHYEHMADVQMLAMLSCIFSESPPDEESAAIAAKHLPQPRTPIPLKAPSFSLDYFPADASFGAREAALATGRYAGRTTTANNTSAATTPRIAPMTATLSIPGSHPSEEGGLWLGDPTSGSFSANATPPATRSMAARDTMMMASSGGSDPLMDASRRGGGASHAHSHSHTALLSSSADAKPFRLHPNLASALGANLPRHLSGILSSSPPGVRKRPSPAADSSLSNQSNSQGNQNLTPTTAAWSVTATLGDSASTRRTATSEDDAAASANNTLHVPPPLVAYRVDVLMEDQTQFDDDGWMTAPMLERGRTPLYAAWRYAYSEMLQMWGESLSRLEILKFCVLTQNTTTHTHVSDSYTAHPPGRGLDVTGICFRHEMQLDPRPHPHPTTFLPLSVVAAAAAAAEDRAADTNPPSTLAVPSRSQSRPQSRPPSRPQSRPQSVPQSRPQSRSQAQPHADPSSHSHSHLPSHSHPSHSHPSHFRPSHTGGGAVGSCRRCRTIQTQLRCVYCLGPIDGLYAPCLGCGCASHDECLVEWHRAGETVCPAGDECDCVLEASNGQVESWAAIMGALGMSPTPTPSRCGTAGEQPADPEKAPGGARRSFGMASLLGKTASLVLGTKDDHAPTTASTAAPAAALHSSAEHVLDRFTKAKKQPRLEKMAGLGATAAAVAAARGYGPTGTGSTIIVTPNTPLASGVAGSASQPPLVPAVQESPAKISLGNRLRIAGNWSRTQGAKRGSVEQQQAGGSE